MQATNLLHHSKLENLGAKGEKDHHRKKEPKTKTMPKLKYLPFIINNLLHHPSNVVLSILLVSRHPIFIPLQSPNRLIARTQEPSQCHLNPSYE